MKRLFLIAGPMGIGKTTTAKLIANKLKNSICLDGDGFWVYDPNNITEESKKQVIQNIINGLNKHIQENKYTNIIFTWIMHQQFIIDSIVSKLNLKDIKLVIVTLDCEEKELIHRINKDIKLGLRKQDVIERSLSRSKDAKNNKTIHIDVTKLSVEEVADKIISL